MLDLAQAEPVRRRFGFTDDDLDTLDRLGPASPASAGGSTPTTAAPFGLDGFLQNTWRVRARPGARRRRACPTTTQALARHRRCRSTTSAATSIDLAGRLAELRRPAAAATDRLDRHPAARRLARRAGATGVGALTEVDRDDAWQIGAGAARAGPGRGRRRRARRPAELRLADVRALLGDRLAGRPTRANFRTGTLTVCTMVPMRSVPHRVVCLLGLDDGVFPRRGAVDGDDVLARAPGDRRARPAQRGPPAAARRDLAATERLVITYTGANERTGQPRPPAVPLGELLDAARPHHRRRRSRERDRRAAPAAAASTRATSSRAGSARRRPFTFDPTQLLAGATVAAGPRPAAAAVPRRPAAAPVPARPEDVGAGRPGRLLPRPGQGLPPRPLDADPAVGRRRRQRRDAGRARRRSRSGASATGCSRDLLAGVHPDRRRETEWRRGALPPGRLGWRRRTEVREQAMQLAVAALTHRQVRAALASTSTSTCGGGRRLTGTVPGVYGDRLVAVGYSRLDGQAAAAVLGPAARARGRRTPTTTGPRSPSAGRRAAARPRSGCSGPLDDRAARPCSRDLVDLYDDRAGASRCRCRSRPSFAWADGRAAPATSPAPDGAQDGAKSGSYPGEDADAAHVRVWGAHADLDRRSATPRRGEDCPARHRLGALRRAVWEPLLRCEQGAARDREPVRPARPAARGRHHAVLEASAGTGKTYAIAALVTRYVAEGAATLDEMLRRHLRPGGQPGAARAGPRPAGRRPSGRSRDPARGRRRRRPAARPPASTAPTTSAPAPAAPAARRAGRLRRGHHRDHPPVLPAGAALARRRRRHRRRGHAWSRTSTTWSSEVVDDLYLRAFGDRRGRAAVHPRRGARASPATSVGDPQARLEPAASDRPTTPAGRRVALRATPCAPRSTGASAGSASSATTTCSAGSPTRSRPTTAPAREPDAAALADRAGRRVPGHRPGAVGGARPRLQRPRHDGADRRPQAGDLRLPRRRRRHLPRRPPRPPTTQQTPRHQLAQRRSRWSTRSRWCSAAPRSATDGIVVRDGRRPTTAAAGWSVRRADAPFRLRVVRREDARQAAGTRRSPWTACGRTSPRDLAADVAPAARLRRDVRRRAELAAARRRGARSRPRATRGRCREALAGGRRARRRSPAAAASSRRPAAAEWLTPARGAGAAAPQRPGPGRGADLLLRPHRRRARRRRRRPHRRGRPRRCAAGPSCSRPAAWPRCSRRPRSHGLAGAGARRVGGERRLTDLRHVGEAAARGRAAASGSAWPSLLTWLREQVAEASARARSRAHPPARQRRRRGPDRHRSTRSKGLQYPVVYLPFAFDRHVRDPSEPRSSTTTSGRAASTSAAAAPAGPTTCAAQGRRGGRRGCGCSTSR